MRRREAQAEDCLSAKPATVAGVREFRRRAGGAFSRGERRSTDGVPTKWVVMGTVESGWRQTQETPVRSNTGTTRLSIRR